MQQLKLLALDPEDLEIVSAHLQDAVLRIADIAYVPSDSRFAMIVNRFDWVNAGDGGKGSKKNFQRHRTALRFDRVLSAKFRKIRLSAKDAVLELLAVQFEETNKPEGYVTLVFAGGGAIRLHVECIEAEMRDLGPVWKTKNLPEHEDSGDAKAET
ncbi:MAG: DUF2948 family protein [Hyphomicrobiaceae bacterium]|nr:DUF2948 family protein [Hyphomicrobiaceae bacterium]